MAYSKKSYAHKKTIDQKIGRFNFVLNKQNNNFGLLKARILACK